MDFSLYHIDPPELPVKMANATSFTYSFVQPVHSKRYKHIDMSEGVNIKALAYLLGLKEFWKSKEEQSAIIDR